MPRLARDPKHLINRVVVGLLDQRRFHHTASLSMHAPPAEVKKGDEAIVTPTDQGLGGLGVVAQAAERGRGQELDIGPVGAGDVPDVRRGHFVVVVAAAVVISR
jgi:hypothetical protein